MIKIFKSIKLTQFSTLVLFCVISQFSSAQIKNIEIGVNGLTCSQCTNSVEKSLSKLDFITSIDMDLQKNSGVIEINEKEADLRKIKKAVEDAGFSIFYVKLNVDFKEAVVVDDGKCIVVDGFDYQFVNVESKQLLGVQKLTLIGNDFMPKKQFKKCKRMLPTACNEKAYFVTL